MRFIQRTTKNNKEQQKISDLLSPLFMRPSGVLYHRWRVVHQRWRANAQRWRVSNQRWRVDYQRWRVVTINASGYSP